MVKYRSAVPDGLRQVRSFNISTTTLYIALVMNQRTTLQLTVLKVFLSNIKCFPLLSIFRLYVAPLFTLVITQMGIRLLCDLLT